MSMIKYTLTLLSDAEPGTGMGTEALNALVPRSADGIPVIRASHLKGLVRAMLEPLEALLGQPLCESVRRALGEAGVDGGDGVVGACRFTSATPGAGASVRTISRTAISPLGTVEAMSLRTVEAVAAGTTFSGRVHFGAGADSSVDLLVRLALLSTESIGAGRTRGAGACRVEIDGETRTPGTILKALDRSLRAPAAPAELRQAAPLLHEDLGDSVWCRLRFEATGAVCCSELPLVANNVIRTGIAIPASAVQGALLTRLSAIDDALASACFASSNFRCWPLIPVGSTNTDVNAAVRVDLAHRMSKLADASGRFEFADSAIRSIRWQDHAGGSPLKASDGVLLRLADGSVRLWRGGDIPRDFTAHAVHPTRDGRRARNLFTVEALAPTRFLGVALIPRMVFDALRGGFEGDPEVVLGRAQGVRGGGRLTLEAWPSAAEELAAWRLPDEMERRVFVAQSPLGIPDDWEIGRAEKALARLVAESGWGEVIVDERFDTARVVRTMATCGVRFGWNRRGLGMTIDAKHRLRASRVFLPGSVFVLKRAVDPASLEALLKKGVGVGRECGFGAVIPHPGIASALYAQTRTTTRLASRDEAGRTALALLGLAGDARPSPSQLAELCRRAVVPGRGVIEYLEAQRDRSGRFWDVWKGMDAHIRELHQESPERLARALRALQDMLVEQRSKNPRAGSRA